MGLSPCSQLRRKPAAEDITGTIITVTTAAATTTELATTTEVAAITGAVATMEAAGITGAAITAIGPIIGTTTGLFSIRLHFRLASCSAATAIAASW